MKKVLIVDDETLSRKKIQRFLEERPDRFEILEAENGLQALDIIEEQKPDIVFLDIEMPEMSGMDLLNALPVPQFHLIFQTAYSEYAVQAFDKSAVDYLLKPFNQERFNQALDKCLNKPGSQVLEGVENLKAELQSRQSYLSKVIVKRGTKNTLIDIDNVICFRSENHYTYVCTSNFEYIYSEPLKDLLPKLNPEIFRQVHRNAIINLHYVKEVIEGDNMQAVMSNDQRIQVSRSHRGLVKEMVLQR